MTTSRLLRSRLTAILLSTVFAVSLALPSATAGDDAPALPLTASFGAGTPGENSGPYALTLTSTADHALTVTATITFSVQSHNRPQTKVLADHEIAAGGSWTIDDLAAQDKVVVTAEGYAPLELTTPAGK
ncbi:MAG: hypothetical protein R3F07_12240 [Opitutaceae bacterium]